MSATEYGVRWANGTVTPVKNQARAAGAHRAWTKRGTVATPVARTDTTPWRDDPAALTVTCADCCPTCVPLLNIRKETP